MGTKRLTPSSSTDSGLPGLDSHGYIAYADNSDGTAGFSITDPLKDFVGTYTGFGDDPQSEDPAQYNWVRIKGEQGIAGKDGHYGPGVFYAPALENFGKRVGSLIELLDPPSDGEFVILGCMLSMQTNGGVIQFFMDFNGSQIFSGRNGGEGYGGSCHFESSARIGGSGFADSSWKIQMDAFGFRGPSGIWTDTTITTSNGPKEGNWLYVSKEFYNE